MSVTIRINNNENYCREYCPDLIVNEPLDPNDPYDVPTIEGLGGKLYFEYFPFEMNLANENFRSLWCALSLHTRYGYDAENLCGKLYPDIILVALDRFKPKSLVFDDIQDGNLFLGGISIEQSTRYYWSLRQICEEAKKRNEWIFWS